MIRFIFIVSLFSSVCFAGTVEHFQEKKTNQVVCKVYFNGYMLIDQSDATLTKIGMDSYFKLKNKNFYIPTSSCKVIKKESASLPF